MPRWELRAGVGWGQPNERRDVLIVQQLLNRSQENDPDCETLKEDGRFGPRTAFRLRQFQASVVHLRRPDGIVDVHGPTQARFGAALPAAGPQQQAAGDPEPRATLAPNDALARALHRRAALPKIGFKKDWINQALPVAIQVKAKWHVPIAVTIAQGALESNWGRSAPGHVYFGVKGTAPDGRGIKLATHEVTNGVRHGERDNFRSYDTLAASADDFGRFLATNHRYQQAFLHCGDPDLFIHYVAINRYATDPDYERKIRTIMAANGLKDFDRDSRVAATYNDAVSIGYFG